jgi:hypothetical protein
MWRRTIAAALISSAASAQAPSGPACDSILRATAVRAERTLVFIATSNKAGGKIPRPFADDLLERMRAAFTLPAKIALPVYNSTPGRLPHDSLNSGTADWLYPSTYVFARVTFDTTGTPRQIRLLEWTHDVSLDSAFLVSLRKALADTSVTNRNGRSIMPGKDSVVIDIEMSDRGWMSKKALATREARVKKNELLVLPIARVMLPHYPNAKAVVPVRPKTSPVFPPAMQQRGKTGKVVIGAILDTAGTFVEPWFVESTNRDFEDAVLAWLPDLRPKPATIAGCPVPVRIRQPVNFAFRAP